jgi:tRNA(His) guanylyltransferase
MDEDNDTLGDRMKAFEAVEARRVLDRRLPAIARLDGRHFHAFTEGLRRPYDPRLLEIMHVVTKRLLLETGAVLGYTQSDEISLVWLPVEDPSAAYFGSRVAKMTSSLAAFASVHFYSLMLFMLPEKAGQFPTFDCRVWTVPTIEEAANAILWRERDARKNSLSMVAQSEFSVGELHGASGRQMLDMLRSKGLSYETGFPAEFRRGTFLRREVYTRAYAALEVSALPPKHRAHRDPDLKVTRYRVVPIDLPPLDSVTNRAEALFCGAPPVCAEEGDHAPA